MKNTEKKTRSISLLALICGMLFFGACGYEKNEVDYENEIEAAENEVGDHSYKPEELTNEDLVNDTLYDGEQPARIDGQEGHPAPPSGEENDYDKDIN